MTSTSATAAVSIPFYRNVHTIGLILQIIFGLLVTLSALWLMHNMLEGLARQNLRIQFDFMQDIAGFSISEGIAFQPQDSYWRAFWVGTVNTLYISLLATIFSTLIGVIVGVARLSHNFLVRTVAAAFVELLRNIPLLVLLFFCYSLLLKLPNIRQAIALPGGIFISNRGCFFPWWEPTASTEAWLIGLTISVIAGILAFWGMLRRERQKGLPQPKWLVSLGTFLGLAVLSALVLPESPLRLSSPTLTGLNFKGGLRLTSEFFGLWLGLTLYTSAFIAEVVRAGILAIHKGQSEAAYALGLNRWLTLRLVILPQAMRVIFPPLANIYLSLLRNSTLGVAIGFADQFQVSMTILNQSGNAIPVMLLIMAFHLAASILIAGVINWFNARVAILTK